MEHFNCETCGTQYSASEPPPAACAICDDDRRYVSFMYSFPNDLPLSAASVRRVAAAVEPFEFDRIYGAWWDRVVATGARAAVARSAERYIRALESA